MHYARQPVATGPLKVHWERNERGACAWIFDVCELAETRHVNRRLEYHEDMCLVMSIDCLAIPTEVFSAVCTTVPRPTNSLHTAVAQCGRVHKK